MNKTNVACGRKDFLKLALTGAAVGVVSGEAVAETVIPTPRWNGSKHPLAGKILPKWQKGQFQVHHIHTGVAESSFWIFPDGTTALVDCGCHPAINRGKYAVQVLPNGNRHSSEWIARYVERVNPNGHDVDYMVLTHYHSDHGGAGWWGDGVIDWKDIRIMNSGFVQASKTLRFGIALDRCYPTYDQPIPAEKGTVNSLDQFQKMYRYLSEKFGTKVERFRVGAVDQIVPRRDPKSVADFTVTNICGNGVIRTRDGGTRDLYAKLHDLEKIDENSASTGVIVQYGAFRFLSAGDFAGGLRNPDGHCFNVESELGKEIDPVDVAKISHHGYYSTPPEYVRAIRPRVWTSCVWDQLHNEEHTMRNIATCKGYNEERIIIPTVFPAERQISDAKMPWMPDIAPESFGGCHVVITVPPGGRTYTVACLDATDEKMKVIGAYDFKSKGI